MSSSATWRLKATAEVKELDLDLRKPTGLDRSHLLRRLAVLGAPWGELLEVGVGRNDRVLKPTPDTVLSVAFTPDRKWLLVTGSDSAIRSWQVESATAGESLRGHNHDVYTLAISDDGQMIASGGDDRTVRIWR